MPRTTTGPLTEPVNTIARQVDLTCEILLDAAVGQIEFPNAPIGPRDRLTSIVTPQLDAQLCRDGDEDAVLGLPDEEMFAAARAASPQAALGVSTAMSSVHVGERLAVVRSLVIVAADASFRVGIVGRLIEPELPMVTDLGCAEGAVPDGDCAEAYRQACAWLGRNALEATAQLSAALRDCAEAGA